MNAILGGVAADETGETTGEGGDGAAPSVGVTGNAIDAGSVGTPNDSWRFGSAVWTGVVDWG